MISSETRNSEVLTSWKEIASYIGRGVRTVQRWERQLGLPVRRKARCSTVTALSSEIDAWIAGGDVRGLRTPKRNHELECPTLAHLLHGNMWYMSSRKTESFSVGPDDSLASADVSNVSLGLSAFVVPL